MRFPNLKIILRSRPSIFKFHLMRAVIFLLRKFSSLQSQQAGRVGTNSRFLDFEFYSMDIFNRCENTNDVLLHEKSCGGFYFLQKIHLT